MKEGVENENNDNRSHSTLQLYAPGSIEALHPIRALERFHSHARPCFRCVHEAAVADVDAHMGKGPVQRVVEDEVARLELREIDGHAAAALLQRGARHPDTPGFLVHVGDETAAVEAGRMRASAIAIIEA